MDTKPFEFFLNVNYLLIKPTYLQGVPNLDESFEVKILPVKEGVKFLDRKTNQERLLLLKDEIVNISILDQSTIGDRVGFKRLLLVGIFALAWKKRTAIPLSFLVIDYRDRFGAIQEMFIQSEAKEGFQFFTNVKYNLQRCWDDIFTHPNADSIISTVERNKAKDTQEERKTFAIGCLFIIIIAVTLVLFL